MVRMMRCCVTGDTGTDFIKVDGKYYKNMEIYNSHKAKESNRTNIMIKICELLGYENPPGYLCGFIGKKLKEVDDYQKFYDCLLMNENYIKEIYSSSVHEKDIERIVGIFTIVSKSKKPILTYGGCYQIENLDTHEIYIGESIDLFKRISQHIGELYKRTHHCKVLQNAFNEVNDISHFKFTPLFLYEIKSGNRNDEKHNTLYLESAYYLNARYEKKTMYNTINPYIALKENNVHLENYDIDCKRVLEMINEDKENILPDEVKSKLLKYSLQTENK